MAGNREWPDTRLRQRYGLKFAFTIPISLLQYSSQHIQRLVLGLLLPLLLFPLLLLHLLSYRSPESMHRSHRQSLPGTWTLPLRLHISSHQPLGHLTRHPRAYILNPKPWTHQKLIWKSRIEFTRISEFNSQCNSGGSWTRCNVRRKLRWSALRIRVWPKLGLWKTNCFGRSMAGLKHSKVGADRLESMPATARLRRALSQ